MGSVLRLGDVETRANEAVEILVKYSKCTALARPKSWKRFGNAGLNGTKIVTSDKDKSARGNAMTVDGESQARVKSEDEDRKEVHWRQLRMRTEYYLSKEEVNEENVKPEDGAPKTPEESELVDEDQLVRGFKYGSTYVPCPEGQFPKMSTVTGIDICGFFYGKKVGPGSGCRRT
jgi:ATP-dependent DNA helicase 2 subunit 2